MRNNLRINSEESRGSRVEDVGPESGVVERLPR